jgi:hypothetical protein
MTSEQEQHWVLRRRQIEWAQGGSAVPVIELLLELGRIDEAGATGRIALRMDREDDRERIEELLAIVESTPEGWDTAIADFAAHPSKEAWDAIIRFAPLERIYDWAEKAVRQLVRGECDADALILCAAKLAEQRSPARSVPISQESAIGSISRISGNRTKSLLLRVASTVTSWTSIVPTSSVSARRERPRP